jgi:hypothetical protein
MIIRAATRRLCFKGPDGVIIERLVGGVGEVFGQMRRDRQELIPERAGGHRLGHPRAVLGVINLPILARKGPSGAGVGQERCDHPAVISHRGAGDKAVNVLGQPLLELGDRVGAER